MGKSECTPQSERDAGAAEVDRLLADLADLADATVDLPDGIDYRAAAVAIGAAIDAHEPGSAGREAFLYRMAWVMTTAALGNVWTPVLASDGLLRTCVKAQ